MAEAMRQDVAGPAKKRQAQKKWFENDIEIMLASPA
jgi:hypothetical protein